MAAPAVAAETIAVAIAATTAVATAGTAPMVAAAYGAAATEEHRGIRNEIIKKSPLDHIGPAGISIIRQSLQGLWCGCRERIKDRERINAFPTVALSDLQAVKKPPSDEGKRIRRERKIFSPPVFLLRKNPAPSDEGAF